MTLMRWGVIIVFFGLLGGCVTRPTVAPPLTVAYPLPKTFELTGRASVKYQGGGDYVRFIWQVDKTRAKIYLNSPIGTNVAEIDITPDEAIFRKGQKVWKASDAEALMDLLLKWHFPVKGLHYWILGLAAPDKPAQWENKAEGWYLTQAGWQMYFSQYVEVEEENIMRRVPKRVEANSPDLAINIVIEKWRLGRIDE